MEEQIRLKDIYLGIPDGETEARSENVLELFFDANGLYSKLNDNTDKFMIIGSKGSGKSYFAHYFCKKKNEKQVRKIIDSQNYLLADLCYLDKSQVGRKGIVFALCKWFVLNNLADTLIEEHSRLNKFFFSNVYKLKKFKSQYDDDSIYKIIKGSSGSGKSSELGCSSGKTLKIDENSNTKSVQGKVIKQKNTAYEVIPKQFYEIVLKLEEYVFKAIGRNDDIALLFDNLDELDKTLVDNPMDNDIILNLIKVTKEFTNRFADSKKKVRLILLIRADVINRLQVYDGNLSKIKKSCGIELYWLTTDKEAPEEHPLMKMLLYKIKKRNKVAANMTDKELFNSLFPEDIDNKKPLDYLLSYSFGRPRDIISYLNHVIDQYGNKRAFYASDLRETRKLYSADFYDELLNLASFHKSSEFINDCFRLISGMKRPSFTYKAIEEYYEQNKQYFSHIDELKDALEFLYEIGAIGNSWTKNDKTCTAWSYRKDSMQTIDYNLKFTIHYALRKKFSL